MGVQNLVIFHRFLDFKFFYKFLTFLGGKKLYLKKCSNNGLVLEEQGLKYL